jgi:hypothetical protein
MQNDLQLGVLFHAKEKNPNKIFHLNLPLFGVNLIFGNQPG